MKCTECGFENDEDAKFCENCGASLKTKSSKPEKIKNNKILLIIVIAAIIGIWIIGGALKSSYSDNNNNKENYTYVTGSYNSNGIYFELPGGWKARNGGNSSYLSKALLENSDINLYVYKYDDENLTGYIEPQTTYLRRWGGYADISNTADYSIIDGYSGNEEEYVKEYIFQKGNAVYVLKFSSKSSLKSYQYDIIKIVSSFKVV
jgi:hypothetical protein